MSTTQSPQDEIAAMQATLARHDEDLERIKQRMLDSEESTRALLENIVAELTETRDNIAQELRAVNERLDTHTSILNAHTERLDTHTSILNAHTERLDAHTSILNAHTERLDTQAAAQANTDLEITSIKETLAALVARTDAIVEDIGAMSKTLTETNSRVGNLAGTRYERRVARIICRRPSRTIGLTQPQVLHTDWGETDTAFLTLLSDADTITDDEYEDLLDSGIILVGQNAAGQNAYAVVEIGITVSSIDVNRAARRARTLVGASGAGCAAIVVGSEIPEAEQERAARTEVSIISITERID